MVRKGDTLPSGLGSIPGSGGWGLGLVPTDIYVYVNVNKSVS